VTRNGGEHVFICEAETLPPGARVVREIAGRSIGLFNVGGRFYALQNRCPHRGGPVCLGPVTGTALPSDVLLYDYGREGEIVRCAWHGWEFDIATGRAVVDPTVRARTYPVEVKDGRLYVVM
jgi:nitrite reductase (NADH) small subunit